MRRSLNRQSEAGSNDILKCSTAPCLSTCSISSSLWQISSTLQHLFVLDWAKSITMRCGLWKTRRPTRSYRIVMSAFIHSLAELRQVTQLARRSATLISLTRMKSFISLNYSWEGCVEATSLDHNINGFAHITTNTSSATIKLMISYMLSHNSGRKSVYGVQNSRRWWDISLSRVVTILLHSLIKNTLMITWILSRRGQQQRKMCRYPSEWARSSSTKR